jgi:hypothetical protein
MTGRPDERSATSNEAALRFRLRAEGIATLPDRTALDRFAAAQPAAFAQAMRAFAGVPAGAADLPVLVGLLLDADLRPDDRLLVAGVPPWPWLGALGVALVTDAAQADVVVAPASWLGAAGVTAVPGGRPRVVAIEEPA